MYIALFEGLTILFLLLPTTYIVGYYYIARFTG
jgi:hypothetical protein